MEITTLVEQHYESVYRFAYRLCGASHVAEDLTQQGFLDAQRKLDTLREPDKARAWLFMIVRNLHRRRLRDMGTRGEVALESLPEPPDDAVKSLPLDNERLQDALSELAEEFRTVVVLFYFRELSYREIADHLDVPVGTVMSRLSRAKQYLRGRLNAEDY